MAGKVIFKSEQVKRLQQQMQTISEDTNHLRQMVNSATNSWSTELPVFSALYDAQNRLSRLTSDAEEFVEVIRKAIQGVEQEQRRSEQRQSGVFGSLLSGIEDFFRRYGAYVAATLVFPLAVSLLVTKFVTDVVAERRFNDEWKKVPRVKQLLNQAEHGTEPEKQQAQAALAEIYKERDNIARAEIAWDVYKDYGNKDLMDLAHKEAERSRQRLRDLGVEEEGFYDEKTDLRQYYKGAEIDACSFDPSYDYTDGKQRERIEIIDDNQYKYLLELGRQQNDQGNYARRLLAEIHDNFSEIGRAQVAYGEYTERGMTDYADDSHQYAQTIRAKLEGEPYFLSAEAVNGLDAKKFWTGTGPAGEHLRVAAVDADHLREAVKERAEKWLGKLFYETGGDLYLSQNVGEDRNGGQPHGLDCSGFVRSIYNSLRKEGIVDIGCDLEGASYELAKQGQIIYSKDDGTELDLSKLKVGDLLFFDHDPNSQEVIDHVGIYVGNGQIIHSNGGGWSAGNKLDPNDPQNYVNIKDMTDGDGALTSYYKQKIIQVNRMIKDDEMTSKVIGTDNSKSDVAIPDSYAAGINALRAKHPNWSLEFFDAGLSISEMVQYHHNSNNLTNDSRWIDQSDTTVYESGGWRKASEYGLQQNIDPNSNDSFNDKDIYQYMYIGNNNAETVDGVKELLKDTALESYAQSFYDAAKKYNLSAYYLCASAIVESTGGTSALAKGVIVNKTTVYNYFGIGANTGDALQAGSNYAYKNNGSWYPWNSAERAIFGGAEFVSNNYVHKGQDTIYTMKYNLSGYINSKDKDAFFNDPHEYAANIGKPWEESEQIATVLSKSNLPIVFKIPIYRQS
jgi:beta-N-acetylglucosaminidase/cell wall-associated NlpC family hydrolase